MLTLHRTDSTQRVVHTSMARDDQSQRPDEQTTTVNLQSQPDDRDYSLMSEEQLEEAADELLQESVAALGRGDYSFYSHSWLRQLAEREAGPAVEAELTTLADDLPQLCLRLLAQTPMKRQWRAAIRLSIKGMTVREIASRLDTSPAGTSRWIKAGLARLAAAAVDLDELYNQREAIRAVWQEETRRYALRKERHCKPGQEACRHSGLCIWRWYLLFEQ